MASELKMLDGGVSLKMGYTEDPQSLPGGHIITTVGQLTVFFDDTYPSAVLATNSAVVEVDLADLFKLLKIIYNNK